MTQHQASTSGRGAAVFPPSPDHPVTADELARIDAQLQKYGDQRVSSLEWSEIKALVLELRIQDAVEGAPKAAVMPTANPPQRTTRRENRIAAQPSTPRTTKTETHAEWARRVGALAFTAADAAAGAAQCNETPAAREAKIAAGVVDTYNKYGPGARLVRR